MMIRLPRPSAATLYVTVAAYAFAALASTSNAFVVPSPPTSSVSTSTTSTTGTAASFESRSTSPAGWSVLYAEEGSSSSTDGTGASGASSPSDSVSSAAKTTDNNLPKENDILNSPAFLKRKLEVLQADIEKTQASLEEAEQRVVVAKEEWGPQLELLQKEVRCFVFLFP